MTPLWQQIALVALILLSGLGVWRIFAICHEADARLKAEVEEAERRARAAAAFEKWDRAQRDLTAGSEQGL